MTRSQRTLREQEITVRTETYDDLLKMEIEKVVTEKEMLEQRVIRENELAALKIKHAEEMHTAKLEMIKKQTEVFSLQVDILKKAQSLPQCFSCSSNTSTL